MDKEKLRRLLIGDFTWKRLIKSLLFLYVFFFIFGLFFPEYLIFRPPDSSYQRLKNGFVLETKDRNEIYCLFLKKTNSKRTVLFFHGNGEDLGHTVPFLKDYFECGFSVFSFDYRGYGLSKGKSNEMNLYNDLDVIYEHMTTKLNIPPETIIVHGRSVGGGLAAEAALKYPVGGLILESSFISVFRVLTRIKIYPFDQFDNLKKIKNISVPKLIIHGKNDRVISFWHGKKLFDEANKPKKSFWVEQAGHNDLSWIAGEQYWEELKSFINDIKI